MAPEPVGRFSEGRPLLLGEFAKPLHFVSDDSVLSPEPLVSDFSAAIQAGDTREIRAELPPQFLNPFRHNSPARQAASKITPRRHGGHRGKKGFSVFSVPPWLIF
jgi:hypothetical protein